MPVCQSNNAGESVHESIEMQLYSWSSSPAINEQEFTNTKPVSTASTESSESTSSSNTQQKLYSQRLEQKDKILLFQLCIQHSLSFQSGNHKQFWMKISALFKQSTKHSYSWQSVQQKIEALTVKQKTILEKKKTDKTQISENSLSQIINEWLEIWDSVKKKKANKRLFKVQQEKNVSITTKYQANLLKIMSQKHCSSDNEEIEDNTQVFISFESEFFISVLNPPIHFNKQHQKPRVNDEISKKMMNTLQKVSDVLIKKTEAGQTDDQIDSLAKKMKKIKKNLDKQKNQLALILSFLQKE